MNSSLYECQVMHARFAPRSHRFLYRIFLFAIDLDELEMLPPQLALFSVGRRNLYSFCDGDFFPTDEKSPPAAPRSLKERVMAYARLHGVDLAGGRIVLVTLPRVLGFLFNPVSFYFCYDRHGAPAAAIAEVTNTFREVKPFFLGPDSLSLSALNSQLSTGGEAAFRHRVPKHFYVSPYSDVDVAFDFTLRTPSDRLSVQIDDYVGHTRTLASTLTGSRRALTSGRLAWFTVKYPLITLRIITLIHWHALRLWWKKVPWFAKAARPADQRDLYRPHHSLQPTDAA